MFRVWRLGSGAQSLGFRVEVRVEVQLGFIVVGLVCVYDIGVLRISPYKILKWDRFNLVKVTCVPQSPPLPQLQEILI